MTRCDDVQIRLSAFVDGDLAPDEQRLVAAHVDACAACGGIVRDLDALRGAARSLGGIEPPPRIFAALADRVPDQPSAHQWLRLAAAVAVVTIGVYAVVRFDRTATTLSPQSGNAVASVTVEATGDEWRAMVTHYEQAIAALEIVTERDDHTLDPAIAATLQTNLTQVNDAIDQSRAALATDPDSQPARDGLSESLRRKMTVLQETVAVITEAPKGD